MSDLTNKTIEELEIDDGELRIIRQRISAEKHALQGELAGINVKLKAALPKGQFFALNARRGQIVRQLQDKEIEFGEINSQRHEILTVLEVRKRQANKFTPDAVRQLVLLRDHFHEISMDSKKHQKAREIAWQASQSIRDFLKPYFKREET